MTRHIGKKGVRLELDHPGLAAVNRPSRIRVAAGWAGVCAAASMLLWLVVGWTGVVPSMLDVFGMNDLRIPAGVAIGGLLLAAFGFNDF